MLGVEVEGQPEVDLDLTRQQQGHWFALGRPGHQRGAGDVRPELVRAGRGGVRGVHAARHPGHRGYDRRAGRPLPQRVPERAGGRQGADGPPRRCPAPGGPACGPVGGGQRGARCRPLAAAGFCQSRGAAPRPLPGRRGGRAASVGARRTRRRARVPDPTLGSRRRGSRRRSDGGCADSRSCAVVICAVMVIRSPARTAGVLTLSALTLWLLAGLVQTMLLREGWNMMFAVPLTSTVPLGGGPQPIVMALVLTVVFLAVLYPLLRVVVRGSVTAGSVFVGVCGTTFLALAAAAAAYVPLSILVLWLPTFHLSQQWPGIIGTRMLVGLWLGPLLGVLAALQMRRARAGVPT